MPRRTASLGLFRKNCGKTETDSARLPGVVETPLDAGIRLPQAKFCFRARILHPQPGVFVGELDALADSEIDVDVGRVRDRLIAVEKRHVAQIDFPVEMAGCAGIVGVVGRAPWASAEEQSQRRDKTSRIRLRNSAYLVRKVSREPAQS